MRGINARFYVYTLIQQDRCAIVKIAVHPADGMYYKVLRHSLCYVELRTRMEIFINACKAEKR